MGADWARFAPFVLRQRWRLCQRDYTDCHAGHAGSQGCGEVHRRDDMFKEKSLVTPADVGAGWCGEAIGKKLVGMTYEGGWMVNFMKQTYKDVEWKALPLPTGPKGQADVIFTNAIGVNAATKFPKAAAAFAIFVTGGPTRARSSRPALPTARTPTRLDLVVDPNDKAISRAAPCR